MLDLWRDLASEAHDEVALFEDSLFPILSSYDLKNVSYSPLTYSKFDENYSFWRENRPEEIGSCGSEDFLHIGDPGILTVWLYPALEVPDKRVQQ